MFQSQTRSQSPGDLNFCGLIDVDNVSFNRRREANPLATAVSGLDRPSRLKVSIADAKPIPWRRYLLYCVVCSHVCFNRRREANPLATNIDLTHFKLLSIVSIADAKPIPWRLDMPVKDMNSLLRFQSQTRSQSPGDIELALKGQEVSWFQSQTRSQSPGDSNGLLLLLMHMRVSIADAKPIPWRHYHYSPINTALFSFNRRREANPLATFIIKSIIKRMNRFNRRREANPLATCCWLVETASFFWFQSQTRSQSPGDAMGTMFVCRFP